MTSICGDDGIKAKLCEIAVEEELLNNKQNQLQAQMDQYNLNEIRDDINDINNKIQGLRAELIDLIKQFRDQETA